MLNPTAPLSLKDPDLFRQSNYIGGAWVQAESGKTITVRNPATNEVIGEVPAISAAETRRAIEAAHAAQPAWRKLTAKERAIKLRRLFDLMMQNQDDLAMIMTAEQGKPLDRIAEAKFSLCRQLSSSGSPKKRKRVYGDTIPQPLAG